MGVTGNPPTVPGPVPCQGTPCHSGRMSDYRLVGLARPARGS